MRTKEPVIARVVRHFRQSPERVFDAFLDPERARRFLFATPSGQMVKVEMDARVGGRFCFVDRRAGEDVEHTGQYLELQRPHRLRSSVCPAPQPCPTEIVVFLRVQESHA